MFGRTESRLREASMAANQHALRALRAEARVDALVEALAAERARYDALLDSYKLLRERGAVEVPVPVTPAALPRVEADPLKMLIAARCGTDMRLRGAMLRQLEIDRASGLKDDAIELSILSGISSDGVPA